MKRDGRSLFVGTEFNKGESMQRSILRYHSFVMIFHPAGRVVGIAARCCIAGLFAGGLVAGRAVSAEEKTGANEERPGWSVGLAACDITPAQPVRMAGYGSKEREQPFAGVASRLSAKAMAIRDSAGQRGLMITTDLIGLTQAVAAPLYQRLRDECDLERDQILVNSSHTHCGPVLRLEANGDWDPEHAASTVRYTQQLMDQLVQVSRQAIDDLSPAKLSWGTGFASFVMNRREATERGIRLGFNPRGLADRSVPVLRIDDPSGKLRGVLFGAACHNTTLGGRDMKISGDFAGYAQQFIESHSPGVVAMFVQGCAGDANPYPRGSEEIARIHGMTLGGEVQRVLEETELQPIDAELRTKIAPVRLPLDTEISETEFALLEQASGSTRAVAQTIREANAAGESLAPHYESVIAVWQLGESLTLVALPGEVVVDYVPLIEEAIGPRRLWVSAYNHDVFGYLPSARTLREGGYEMRGIYAGGTGIFAPEVESVVVDAVRTLAVEVERPSELMPASPSE